MKLIKKTLLIAICVSSLTSLYAKNSTAIFADEHDPDNRVISVDYENMELIDENSVEGSLNHHADVIGTLNNSKYIMMVPKKSTFVTFRKVNDRSFVKKLNLPFQPRSGDAYNATHNLTLLTSGNRPSAVIIDNNSLNIVGQAGFELSCNQYTLSKIVTNAPISQQNCAAQDFGGGLISGHPIWLDANTFAILDRSNRFVHVYGIININGKWKTVLKNSIQTNSSLHQIIPNPTNSTIFYGMTEGNVNTGVLARMYKFSFRNGVLSTRKFVDLSYNGTKGIGGHNLYITPDNQYLYGATASGSVFVVDAGNLHIKNAIAAGKGAGHVNFMNNGIYGAVTNHKANYVTIINWKTHTFVKNITTNFNKENIASLLHSHSPYIEGNYFYNFWTDGGVFYRINLTSLKLQDSVYVGGVPIQGNYFKLPNNGANIASVTTNKDTYKQNESITVNFKNMLANAKDWVAVYPAGSNNDWENVVAWDWAGGVKNGQLTFNNSIPLGNYEVRVFFKNSFNVEARSRFTIGNSNSNKTTVTTNKSSYNAGESVQVNFKNMLANAKDWVAVYPIGSSNDWSNVVDWNWAGGVKNGQLTFTNIAKGKYEVRVFFKNTYKLEAKYNFTVGASNSNKTTITSSKATYRQGQTINISFKNMSANSKDWVGIYPVGSSNDWSNVVAWNWAGGVKNGQLTFNKDIPVGKYEVRAFFNNTFITEAKSNFTVEPANAPI